MKVLISGAGIAGPTLAYWLLRQGFEPVLVEHAPELRTGGYIIDFWGAGFDIAERMGLLPRLQSEGYRMKEVRIVGPGGEKAGGFSVEVFDRMTRGRYLSLARGDLAAAIHSTIAGRVETIFGDRITAISDAGDGVSVKLERGGSRRFDLVVGADGLHSAVRSLAFGEQSRFEKYLGYKVAAFEAKGYRPREELTYVMFTEVGRQLARFAMTEDRTLFLFIYADPDPSLPRDAREQKAILRNRFSSGRWESPAILEALDASPELYFDRVSQIRMPAWTRGRVALVGDAAYCVSLLGGQGSALAMIGAYVLAGELGRAGGNHAAAFERYESLLSPFLKSKQKAAAGFAGAFAPRTSAGLWLRNQISRLLAIRPVADLVLGRGLLDKLELPTYPPADSPSR